MDFDTVYTPGNYLLIPVMPTPNGGLHLGHISGPYAKMDMLARHLRRWGNHVRIISGTDAHDSYVLLKAHQLGIPPERVCNQFHERIYRDLQALDISIDVLINPISSEWSDLYQTFYVNYLKTLVVRGVTEIRKEKILYAPSSNRYIVGCWLIGECPRCGSEAGSYFCENCGTCFEPEQIRNPDSRLREDSLEWREIQSLFLRLSDVERLFATFAEMGLSEDFQQIARQYIKEQGPVIRLTQPIEWGVDWEPLQGQMPCSIFTYSAIMNYSLCCGEVYGRLTGTGINAFHPDSGVTVISSFGIDNTVPFLVGCVGGALEHGGYKPFDYFLTNYFYSLEGLKFSTSRSHVIWPNDIIEKTPVGSDDVRYYLARTNPEDEPKNFDVIEFIDFVNEYLRGTIQQHINKAWSEASRATVCPPPDSLIERLSHLLKQQEQAFDPRTFQLSKAAYQIDLWVHQATLLEEEVGTAYWWLKGLSLLAYPVMPQLGQRLWLALGHQETPTISEFTERTIPTEGFSVDLFQYITLSELKPCLPATLNSFVA